MPKTKKCENCDAVIAEDEKVCPACKLDLENLEVSIEQLDIVEKVRQKRRATATSTTTVELKKKKGLFGGLIK
jgi:hypothetical protein